MSTRDKSDRAPPPAEGGAPFIEEAEHTLELEAERHRAVTEAAAIILWRTDAEGIFSTWRGSGIHSRLKPRRSFKAAGG